MTRGSIRRFLATAGMALAALAVAGTRTLSAQADSGRASATAQTKDTTQAAAPLATVTTSVPRYLANHARALHLSVKQVDRIKVVAARLDSTNAPLRAQWQQITGGRALKTMEPAQRRSLAPQLQPIAQQLKANNEAALDSVDAILNPQQQSRLQTVLQEYKRRMQQRQAAQSHP